MWLVSISQSDSWQGSKYIFKGKKATSNVQQKYVFKGVRPLLAIVCLQLSFSLSLYPPTFLLCLFFTISLFVHLFVCESGERICQMFSHDESRLWNLQTYANLIDSCVLSPPRVCVCICICEKDFCLSRWFSHHFHHPNHVTLGTICSPQRHFSIIQCARDEFRSLY